MKDYSNWKTKINKFDESFSLSNIIFNKIIEIKIVKEKLIINRLIFVIIFIHFFSFGQEINIRIKCLKSNIFEEVEEKLFPIYICDK